MLGGLVCLLSIRNIVAVGHLNVRVTSSIFFPVNKTQAKKVVQASLALNLSQVAKTAYVSFSVNPLDRAVRWTRGFAHAAV